MLDLTSPDSTTKLIETSVATPKGPYVTLSHCWGTEGVILKTTKSNLEAFKHQLPDTLPKTFSHAIAATRKLGVGYLWIDSLCIIQDDRGDWELESAQMHQVYQNALCNLAATSSSDGQGGLFFDRPRITRGQVIVWSKWERESLNAPEVPFPESFWIVDDDVFRREVTNGPLLQVRKTRIASKGEY